MKHLKQIEKLKKSLDAEWARTQELLKSIEAKEAEIAAKQAKIDALMLEFCPDEMTPEQIEKWGENQKVSGGEK